MEKGRLRLDWTRETSVVAESTGVSDL